MTSSIIYPKSFFKGQAFLCDTCNKTFDTRKEVFHHTLHEHYPINYGWQCPHCEDKK